MLNKTSVVPLMPVIVVKIQNKKFMLLVVNVSVRKSVTANNLQMKTHYISEITEQVYLTIIN